MQNNQYTRALHGIEMYFILNEIDSHIFNLYLRARASVCFNTFA